MTQQELMRPEGGNLVQHQDVDPILVMIQSAARDPDADVEKMERLMKMYERQQDKQAESAFSKAMNACQAEIGRIATNKKNTQTGSRYADYAAIDRIVRPVYSSHGFALSFTTGTEAGQGNVHVICHVSHSAGHTRVYDAVVPSDGKGAKGNDVMTKTHAYGSGLQYGMRYLIKLIFNIAIGEDDDGNSAGRVNESDLIDESTQADINAMVDEILKTPQERVNFSGWLKTNIGAANGFVRNIPSAKAAEVVAMLEKKRSRS